MNQPQAKIAKPRIPYYDMMKGILICMVIISHISYEGLSVYQLHNDVLMWMRGHQWTFVCFFMPAFFFVTGICSSFNKPFWPFVKANLKTLMLPALCFDLLFFSLPHAIETGDYLEELIDFGRRFYALGGYYWFLVSLFLSKGIYWLVNKVRWASVRWLILLALVMVGYVINHYELMYNHWAICQTCDLTLFLALGQWFRNTKIEHQRIYDAALIIFAIILVGYPMMDFAFPYITATYFVKELWLMPLHLTAATVGSVSLLYLCKLWHHNTVLEYLGRGSLVIYMMHSFVLKWLYGHFGEYVDGASNGVAILEAVLIFAIALGVSCCFVWLFDQKYLKALVGKF